jgi:hypothetical protein
MGYRWHENLKRNIPPCIISIGVMTAAGEFRANEENGPNDLFLGVVIRIHVGGYV